MKYGEKSLYKQDTMGFHGMFTHPKNGSNTILLRYNLTNKYGRWVRLKLRGKFSIFEAMNFGISPILRHTHVMMMLVDVD